MSKWKRGLPPGKVSEKMLEEFEAYPTMMVWVHRKRTQEEIIEYRRRSNVKAA